MLRAGSLSGLLSPVVDVDQDDADLPGRGKAWGAFVAHNTSVDTAAVHPYVCAKACGHRYSKSGANATRIGQHICGHRGHAKACKKATAADKAAFPSWNSSNGSATTSTGPTLGAGGFVNPPSMTVSAFDPAATANQELTLPQLLAMQRAEEERQAMLTGDYKDIPGIFKHMVDKQESKNLHLLWAKAFHHAGIPPNAMEDDYVRDAIFQTSKCKVPTRAWSI
jgi:hypothetical protein